jgi:hypothetical protein
MANKYGRSNGSFHRVYTRLQCRRSRVQFPAETQLSQMLYAKDVDGSGHASTLSFHDPNPDPNALE